MIIAAALGWAGAVVAALRLGRGQDREIEHPANQPLVSIIIPARNEANNLPPLLTSLKALDYPNYDVTVVDDGSTDATAEIAASFGVRVLKGKPLPEGWNGKNWACHQAAMESKGDLLLFTDADTVHWPDGLRRAVGFMALRDAHLISALPHHRCPTIWERLMGPFQALVLVATAYRTPRAGRLYAIGQFLLFRREFYLRIGGHKAVAPLYPDDLALANLTLARGGRFVFHCGRPYFEVRMYANFLEYFNGWRRNVAAGLRQGHWSAAVEVSLVICALFAGGETHSSLWPWLPALFIAGLIALRQRNWGDFSLTGAILYPFAVICYCAVTVAAVIDLLCGGTLKWKGRSLKNWAEPDEK